jgi:hypothetical protein
MIKEAYAVVEKIDLTGSQPGGVKADTPVGTLVASALQIIFIFGGLAVLVFIVWAAFDWITSGGDKEKVAGARKKITNAIIGLVLLALAYFIATLLSEAVGIKLLNQGLIPQLGVPATPPQ